MDKAAKVFSTHAHDAHRPAAGGSRNGNDGRIVLSKHG
jgi:hypothetical protein